MAKPNYQFEKRQRDLAKKNKKEEKQRQKQAGNGAAVPEAATNPAEPVLAWHSGAPEGNTP